MTGTQSREHQARMVASGVRARDWHYPDLATALRGMAASGVAVTEFLTPFQKPDGSSGFGARACYLVATI